MKIVGEDYIDYWQEVSSNRQGQKSRFGIRLRPGRCWPLVQIASEPPSSFGSAQEIPVDVTSLPGYMLIVVEEELVSNADSDLVDVLIGKKSFQRALKSARKPELAETSGAMRISEAS